MSDHRARYKNNGLDSKELRRRREEDSLQLRKQKRDDVLSKRRTINHHQATDELSDDNDDSQGIEQDLTITPEVVEALRQNENKKLLLDNAQKIRKILSKEPQPPFDEVIATGLVPRFIELLDWHHDKSIQFEVAWILTNICSGTSEQTRIVCTHGAIPKLINLLFSDDMKVCEQAVWALGNIIGDCHEFRDLVIGYNFIPNLLRLIKPELEIGFLRNITWVLVNICRTKSPPPTYEVVSQLIPPLIYLIQSADLAILSDTTWAVSYITELGPTYVKLVIDSGLIERMVPLLVHEEIKIQLAAIRALGSIVTGTDDQTQIVLNAGALPHLSRVLKEGKGRVIKEALWFLSNVTAGSKSQIQAVIDNQLTPSIIFHLDTGEFAQQKEATWIIYNMALSGTPKQIITLVEADAIRPLCALLSCQDTLLVRNIVEALHYFCIACRDLSLENLLIKFEECDGIDKLYKLQESYDVDTSNIAYNIIEDFFPDD